MSGSLMPGLGDASLMPFVLAPPSEFPWSSYLSDINTIAWWKFDEVADGANFADSSGNGFTMINGGVNEGVDGVFNYSIYFDGIIDYTKTTMTPLLNIGRNLTVDLVLRRQDLGTGCIASCFNYGGGAAGATKKVGWAIGIGASTCYFVVRTKGSPLHPFDYLGVTAEFDRDLLPLDDWCFLRVTYDGLDSKMYSMNLSAGETELVERVNKRTHGGDIFYKNAIYDTLSLGALFFDLNPAVGLEHFRGSIDQVAISNVIRKYAYGYHDILPAVTEVTNIGRRFDRFDNIYCRKIHADNNLLNPPENTCFVSPSYVDDPGERTFSTVQAAIDHAGAQSPADDDRWLVFIEAGEYDESLNILNHVYLVGRSMEDCIIKNASAVAIVDTQYTGFENLTFEATGSSAIVQVNIAGVPTRFVRFHNCKFVGAAAANMVQSVDGGLAEFDVCFFENAGNPVVQVNNVVANNFKFYHCKVTGNVIVQGGSISFQHTNVYGYVSLASASNFSLAHGSVENETGHAILLGTTGTVLISTSTVIAAGLSGGTNYRSLQVTAQPSNCFICSTTFRWFVAQPDYLVYSGIAFTFYGKNNAYQRGMNGNCSNLCTATKEVSTIGSEYNLIQQAINAATSGGLVHINPGTYTEQITMKSGVVVQGVNKNSCILQRSDQPIAPWSLNSGTTKVKDMTLQVTTPGNTIVELRAGYFDLFENCNFEAGTIVLNGPNLTGFPQFEFEKCQFHYDGGNVINASGNTNRNVKIVLKNCKVTEESLGISWTLVKTGGWMNILQLKNTDMLWGRINVTGTVSLLIDGGTHYNEGGNPNIVSATTAVVSISKASYNNSGASIVSFTAAPSTFNFISNTIGSSTTYDLTSTVAVAANVVSNVMVNGMQGNVKVINPLKLVGGGVDFYKNIQQAINACADGETVGITAGSYSEQLVITDKSLTLQGVGGNASLYATTPVIDLNKTNTSNIVLTLKNMDIGVSGGTNPLIDMDNTNATRYLRVLAYDGSFYTWSNATAISLDGVGACSFFTKNCLLVGEGADHLHIESTAHVNSYLYITQSTHDGARYRLSKGRVGFENTTNINDIVVEAGNTNAQTWTWLNSSFASPITIAATAPTFRASFCTFSRTGENITLTAVNDNLDFKNCSFLSGGSSFNISATATVDMVVLECPMDTGMEGTIQTTNPVKEVGPGVNSYKDVAEALASVKTANCKVVLNEDQVVTAALTPPSYAIMIDGNHQFAITRAAGSPLMTLGANDEVKFVNIDLVGSIDVNGDAAVLQLADHTYLKGLIDIISGNGSTFVKVDQAKIEGDATDLYCIRIADVDPIIVVKRAYLKGDAGDFAIYWTAANDNLKLAYATVMHGSLGANNPFGRSAAQTPNYASHHCAYNSDPETGAIWTNLIAAGQRFDTLDVDADY